jgi:integrase
LANKTVSIVLVAKTEKGWERLPPAWGRNGKLKAQHALIGGQPVLIPKSYYALRTYEGRKTVYRTIGSNVTEATSALGKAERRMAAHAAAAEANTTLVDELKRFDLQVSKEKWLERLESRGKMKSVESVTTAIDQFLSATGHGYSDQITDESMITFYRALRTRGNEDRTVFNKAAFLAAWFRYMKLDVKSIIPERLTFTEKEVEIYDPEEITALLKACRSDYFRVVVQVLYMTGMRKQEAMHLKWVNVDFRRNEIRVREHRAAGSRIKDRAERTVPMPPPLKKVLLKWREVRPTALLVIGTSSDKPNWKWLQTLKRTVRVAGLNCGNCDGCNGSGDCSRWYLHKFRATYTTTLLRSMDPRSVMEITGHEDIETVMRYWKPLKRSEAARKIATISWTRSSRKRK